MDTVYGTPYGHILYRPFFTYSVLFSDKNWESSDCNLDETMKR